MKAFQTSNQTTQTSNQTTRLSVYYFFQHNNRGSCITYELLLHDFSQISCNVFSEPEILKSLYKKQKLIMIFLLCWQKQFLSHSYFKIVQYYSKQMILIKNHSQLKQVMIKIIPNEFIQPLSTIYYRSL